MHWRADDVDEAVSRVGHEEAESARRCELFAEVELPEVADAHMYGHTTHTYYCAIQYTTATTGLRASRLGVIRSRRHRRVRVVVSPVHTGDDGLAAHGASRTHRTCDTTQHNTSREPMNTKASQRS